MRRAITFAVVLFLGGCQSHSRVPSVTRAQRFEIPGVNISDGVSRDEAQLLAWCYFSEFHGSCGAVIFSRETATAWIFKTAVGFDAHVGHDISVFRDGSKIVQKGSPDVVYLHGVWSYSGKNFFGDNGGANQSADRMPGSSPPG